MHLIQAIFKYLEAKQYQDQKDGNYFVANSDLRRLVQIICQKQCIKSSKAIEDVKEEKDSKETTSKAYETKIWSIIQRNFENVEVRDILLKILKLCPEFSLADTIMN